MKEVDFVTCPKNLRDLQCRVLDLYRRVLVSGLGFEGPGPSPKIGDVPQGPAMSTIGIINMRNGQGKHKKTLTITNPHKL